MMSQQWERRGEKKSLDNNMTIVNGRLQRRKMKFIAFIMHFFFFSHTLTLLISSESIFVRVHQFCLIIFRPIGFQLTMEHRRISKKYEKIWMKYDQLFPKTIKFVALNSFVALILAPNVKWIVCWIIFHINSTYTIVHW